MDRSSEIPDGGKRVWLRLAAVKRKAQLWRLRLGIVGVLFLLIMTTVTGFRATTAVQQRQRTLNATYRLHLLSVNLESAVEEVRLITSSYIRHGDTAQRIDVQPPLDEAWKLLASLQTYTSAPSSSHSEVYTDLLPRTRLYLDTLEESRKLLDSGKRKEAIHTLSVSDSYYRRLYPLSLRLCEDQEQELTKLTAEIEQGAEEERNKMWLWTSFVVVLLGVAGLSLSRDMGTRTRQEQALRTANQTLTRLAQQDGLTQLKNRRALEEELHSEWARARRGHTPLSLLFVDVDKFKEYNDTFGHQAGDEALKQVADLLRREEKLSDCCVARYGGEEFAIVLPKTDREAALLIGERVRASFASAVWQGRPVTASVGAATISQGGRGRFSDVDTLLYEADGALYHAKRAGRNQVAHAADIYALLPTATVC
ncbi:MAG: GGDEF domain-containing protein [Armatimonadota bacterium]